MAYKPPLIPIPKREPSSEAVKLTDLLVDLMRQNNPNCLIKAAQVKQWEREADLMFRIDCRSPDEAERLLIWCQTDEVSSSGFAWHLNILSMGKFRKQYDQMTLRRKAQYTAEGRCLGCDHLLRSHERNYKTGGYICALKRRNDEKS